MVLQKPPISAKRQLTPEEYQVQRTLKNNLKRVTLTHVHRVGCVVVIDTLAVEDKSG